MCQLVISHTLLIFSKFLLSYIIDMPSLIYLDIRAPLLYAKVPEISCENDEFLLCYELNPLQSRSIEPDRGKLLGSLVFTGQKTSADSKEEVILPAGNYLFSQCRSSKLLNKDEWLDIAVEQQKDGLWERQKLENLLYVRFLFEDGAYVTQIFRPIIVKA